MKRHAIAVVVATSAMLGASQAWAQEPVGCDKFKWDVTRERAALTQTGIATLASGSALTGPLPQTIALELKSPADAKLPSPPERAPKPDTFAGFTTVDIPANGVYSIALSGAAWVDVLQDGSFLKPQAHSGARGCDGLRKTMKFHLAAGRMTLQLSGVSEPSLKMAVMPVTE